MRKIALLTVLAVVFLVCPAFAEDRHDGFYAGAGLVYNDFTGDIDLLDAGVGWDVKTGYNFGWVAVEANMFKSNHDHLEASVDYEMQGIVLNLKAYFISPEKAVRGYLSIGYGDYELDGGGFLNYQGSGFHIGPGLEVFLNNDLALNFSILHRDIEYDKFKTPMPGGAIDGSTLSSQLGLNFYF
jgi:hypothetical protein